MNLYLRYLILFFFSLSFIKEKMSSKRVPKRFGGRQNPEHVHSPTFRVGCTRRSILERHLTRVLFHEHGQAFDNEQFRRRRGHQTVHAN